MRLKKINIKPLFSSCTFIVEIKIKNATFYSVNVTNNKRIVGQNEKIRRGGFSKINLYYSTRKHHWRTVEFKSFAWHSKLPTIWIPSAFAPLSLTTSQLNLALKIKQPNRLNFAANLCSPAPISFFTIFPGSMFSPTRVCSSFKAQLLKYSHIYGQTLPCICSYLGSCLIFWLECTFQSDKHPTLHSCLSSKLSCT